MIICWRHNYTCWDTYKENTKKHQASEEANNNKHTHTQTKPEAAGGARGVVGGERGGVVHVSAKATTPYMLFPLAVDQTKLHAIILNRR